MAVENRADAGMTIDELARTAQLPVRTIREYHSMRLMPPPQRRGRVGYYSDVHLERLELIARLQRRGYSLAGIRDLLQAWAAGANLTALLGIQPSPAPLDELPLRLTGDELTARVPALSGDWLGSAVAVGLIQPDGDGYHVRSAALLALVADGAAAGVPLGDMLVLADVLRRQLTSVADTVAELIAARVMPAVIQHGDPGDIAPLLQRARMLLLQGAVSTLADRLGAALWSQALEQPQGDALRAALEQVSVGAIGDASGTPRRVAPPR